MKNRDQKKKQKRTMKVLKAEMAGNAMVLGVIAANEEARRDRLDWEKQLCELENAEDAKRAEQDRQLIMTAMGQMMGIFAQYMGPGSSSLLYPMPSYPPYSAGYYQPFDSLSVFFKLLLELLKFPLDTIIITPRAIVHLDIRFYDRNYDIIDHKGPCVLCECNQHSQRLIWI